MTPPITTSYTFAALAINLQIQSEIRRATYFAIEIDELLTTPCQPALGFQGSEE